MFLSTLSVIARERTPSRRGDAAWRARVAPHRRNLVRTGHGARALHYIDLGGGSAQGAGAPVVLVHGYADSTFSWHRNVEALAAAGLRPLLIDLPGLGRSPALPPYHPLTLGNLAAAVVALLDSLGIERAHLVGHSLGGAVVLQLCLTHAERVARAVAIAPVTRRPRRPMLLARPGVRHLAALLPRRVITHALRQVYHDPSRVDARLIDEYARPTARPGYWADLTRLSRELFGAGGGLDALHARLGEVGRAPLLLWGEHDRRVKPRPALAEAIPGARYLAIDAAGHNVHQERPAAVDRALVAHLLGAASGAEGGRGR